LKKRNFVNNNFNNFNFNVQREPVYILDDKHLECDASKKDDDLFVVEYILDIMEWYRECENAEYQRTLIKKDYISSSFQPDLNESMRYILLNWLYNVHRRFKLLDRTLFLGIYIFDAFLSIVPDINRNDLQLIGCAAIWIASKYHEIYAPEANDFAYISDHSFSVDQLFQKEIQILTILRFKFADIMTPFHFMERFLQFAIYPIRKKYEERNTEKAMADAEKYADLLTNLTSYFIELSLFDCKLIACFKPSMIAAASLCFAVLSISLYPRWPDFLRKQTKYKYEELKPVIKRLNQLREISNAKYKSVRKKHPSIKKWLDRLNINAAINNNR